MVNIFISTPLSHICHILIDVEMTVVMPTKACLSHALQGHNAELRAGVTISNKYTSHLTEQWSLASDYDAKYGCDEITPPTLRPCSAP